MSPAEYESAEGAAARWRKARGYLTGRVRLWTGSPFREAFLSGDPPFRAGDVALGFPRRHALLREALDAFYDADLRLATESEREDVRILLKQVERRLARVREAADHFDLLAAGQERAAAEAREFARAMEELAGRGRMALLQSQEAVEGLAQAVDRALKQTYLEPEKVTQMTLQRDPAIEAYLKVSSAAKKWKAASERVGAAWKRAGEAFGKVAGGEAEPTEVLRLHPELLKAAEELAYAGEAAAEVRRDVPLFEEYAMRVGAHPFLLQASEAVTRLGPSLEALAGLREQMKLRKAPDVRPVDPAARARFLELNRGFPWVEEYRKVLAYGEALRNRLSQRMEETAPKKL
ncbi:MAG: hypothetical protein QXT68_00840 [Halobacteria archaeon]